jgi:hypothetical protein
VEYYEEVHQLFMDFRKIYNSVKRKLCMIFSLSSVSAMKLKRLLKICLCETYKTVRIIRLLSELFSIKTVLIKGVVLSPLFSNFALECAIRRVQINQMDLKLNGTRQFLFSADDVNVLGGKTHTVKKNAEVSVVASQETGLVVSAEKTKYMFISRDQNA